MRFAIRGLVTAALAGGLLVAAPVTGGAPAAAAVDAATIGTAPDVAAGSCWEIKQLRPSAADGAYWLLTPSMSQPVELYCDMTTDGGGWVLVGKGRDGWTTAYDGQGDPADLRTPTSANLAEAPTQLPSGTVDDLLDHGSVAGLTDGVRVRRARTTDGSQWQEVRLRYASRPRWSWTFGAEHPMTSYSFDGTTRTGGTSASFGSDQAFNRMVNNTDATRGWRLGFAYGSGVTGQPTASSYLWAPSAGAGGALPYAQVFLRPRITSDAAGFRQIGDSGTAAIATAESLDDDALVSPWAVSGLAGSSTAEGNVEVQAFTQSGDHMYVGGNFRSVQRDANGTGRVEQPFLAAFHVQTGEWLSTFRPDLDEQVSALTTLPDGTVVAGGLFTELNGEPATALVALDPATGEARDGWSVTMENRLSSGELRVRTLDVHGQWLYLGGSFTHLSGGSAPATVRYARNLARVAVADGTPAAWNPNLLGRVNAIDVSAAGDRVYAAGHFSGAGPVPAPNVAAVSTANASVAPWSPTWSTSNATYQQAIAEVGNRVFVGGSEHSLFTFSTSTFERLSGSVTKARGDFQAMAVDDGLVYAGCHCSDWSYSNAFTWPSLSPGWTDAHAIEWFGQWDAATGERVPDFVPDIRSRLGSGIWALEVDSNGTVWAGGDITQVRTAQGLRFSGGFARFARTDTEPPARPGNLRVTAQDDETVTLAWNAPAGAGLGYQLLRGDRPVAATDGATSVTVRRGDSDRYFVRAVDAAGNVGASTPVLVVDGAPVEPEEPVEDEVVVVERGSAWRWRYQAGAPASGWTTVGFDDATWGTGAGVLGFGAATVETDIDTFASTQDRPRAAHFRRTFDISDPGSVTSLELTSVADDGVVIYVNGTEVTRSNMPAGTITHLSYASSARRESVANASPVVVDVPVGLLRQGTNVIAAETHLNYRGTPDLTFDLEATLATGEPSEVEQPTTQLLVPVNADWHWRYQAGAPEAGWNQVPSASASWPVGSAVLGFGAAGLRTDIDTFASTADRPRAAYFTHAVTIDDASRVQRLVLDSVGDDGAVIYVNGTEVARSNMPGGTVTHLTYASSARREAAANADPIVVEVPVGLLVDGTNVIAAETHLNYRGTPDLTFQLRATLTTG
jgi:trimeric autotransporter adhesin